MANPPVVYSFKRSAVLNAAGERILPNIAVIVNQIGPNSGNWVDLYAERMPQLPPTKIERMLDFQKGEVGELNAGGLEGETRYGGRSHTVFVVFALHGEIAINIIMDTTTDVLDQVAPEFEETLQSLRHYR